MKPCSRPRFAEALRRVELRLGERAGAQAAALRALAADRPAQRGRVLVRCGARVAVVAYLPTQRLLYVGTALRPGDADGWERPSQLAAIRALIEREHLDVERVVGSQFPARPMP